MKNQHKHPVKQKTLKEAQKLALNIVLDFALYSSDHNLKYESAKLLLSLRDNQKTRQHEEIRYK